MVRNDARPGPKRNGPPICGLAGSPGNRLKSAHRPRQHALEDGVASYELVIECRADVHRHEQNYKPADPAVKCEQLRRERFVLGDDRRHLEQAEKGRAGPVSGIGDVANDRHGESST